jgi:hypothetical protein
VHDVGWAAAGYLTGEQGETVLERLENTFGRCGSSARDQQPGWPLVTSLGQAAR